MFHFTPKLAELFRNASGERKVHRLRKEVELRQALALPGPPPVCSRSGRGDSDERVRAVPN